ncbi:MAG: ABC transporter permease subunit [Deltaproteobacteria bacterium]|nr:ABC transporter permease subunit [Deltaproteobacteria bacterium]
MSELVRFVARRLAQGLAVVYVVATATFILLRSVPGGPFDREKQLPPEVKANIERKYHLDAPVTTQYLDYLVDLAHLDFGPSLRFPGRSVGEILSEGLPVSATLGTGGLLVAVLFGVSGGLAAYSVRSGVGSAVLAVVLVVGMCMPSFVLAVLLIEVFAMRLGVVPPALWEGFRYAILPVVTLGLAPGVYLARLTRSELFELETRGVRADRPRQGALARGGAAQAPAPPGVAGDGDHAGSARRDALHGLVRGRAHVRVARRGAALRDRGDRS